MPSALPVQVEPQTRRLGGVRDLGQQVPALHIVQSNFVRTSCLMSLEGPVPGYSRRSSSRQARYTTSTSPPEQANRVDT